MKQCCWVFTDSDRLPRPTAAAFCAFTVSEPGGERQEGFGAKSNHGGCAHTGLPRVLRAFQVLSYCLVSQGNFLKLKNSHFKNINFSIHLSICRIPLFSIRISMIPLFVITLCTHLDCFFQVTVHRKFITFLPLSNKGKLPRRG